MNKILYFDTETTGLNPEKNDIIQLAGIVVVHGKEMERFNLKCQPMDWETISDEALTVHGYKLEDLMTFMKPYEMYKQLVDIFSKYINKYDKNDKFTPAGYNVRFDMEFLNNFFKKQNDVYFGSWISWKMIDPIQILHFLDYCKKIALPNYKLSTVCDHFGIDINAHDALSDIQATRQLISKIYEIYFK